jgi:hypothetical protein
MGQYALQDELQTEEHYTFTAMDILPVLKKAAMGKATGSDGVFGEVLHYTAPELASSLAILFNKIEKDKAIPDQWKEALICPVYKKGDKTNIANYRPIALTSVVRRAYEKLLAEKIDEFVPLLQDEQGGFRAKRSTLMQVMVLHEIIVNHPGLQMINLDFKAAYDLVDRRILWKKLLEKFNFPVHLVKQLQLLFDDNRSCLLLNSKKSRFIPNKRGLLQGSSLSPILFNFFIDEMLQEMKACPHKVLTYGIRTNCIAFADDCNIHAQTAVGIVALLAIAEEWSLRVGMLFAPGKCILISEQPNPDYKIYNNVIGHEPRSLYLGIMISEDGIEWEGTATKRIVKTQAAIGLFRDGGMNLTGFAPTASIQIFKTFIRPIYEYGMSLGIYKGDTKEKLQKLQNMALRSIFSAARNTSITAMHKLARIPMLTFRNQELAARFGAQLHNNKCKKIPAVRFWWNGLRTVKPRASLIRQTSTNNPLWARQRKLNHQGLRLTDVQEMVMPPSTLDERNTWTAEHLINLENNPERIAGAIVVDHDPNLRAVLKPGVVDRKQRIAIVKWILGGVAQHNSTCKVCNRELSRAHAIECADVREVLLPKYEPIYNPEAPLNIVDQVLNHHRNSVNSEVYEDIYISVKRIYTRCLGYRQGENGYFRGVHDDVVAPRRNRRVRHVVAGWNRRVAEEEIEALNGPIETDENEGELNEHEELNEGESHALHEPSREQENAQVPRPEPLIPQRRAPYDPEVEAEYRARFEARHALANQRRAAYRERQEWIRGLQQQLPQARNEQPEQLIPQRRRRRQSDEELGNENGMQGQRWRPP